MLFFRKKDQTQRTELGKDQFVIDHQSHLLAKPKLVTQNQYSFNNQKIDSNLNHH